MTSLLARAGAIATLAVGTLASSTATVLAHTGEDASAKHIVIEFGLWGLGVAAVLAGLIALFWIRAKVRERSSQ